MACRARRVADPPVTASLPGGVAGDGGAGPHAEGYRDDRSAALLWALPLGWVVGPDAQDLQEARMKQRQLVSSDAAWESVVGYSRAVRVGSWVAVAGTTAAADGGGAVGGSDVAAQTREALHRIGVALEQAGARLQDVVRTRMFVTDISRWEEIGRVHGEIFGSIRPATSMVEVSRLIDPALLVEIEADAMIS